MSIGRATIYGKRKREGGRPITACDQCRRTGFMDLTRKRWDGLTVCVAGFGDVEGNPGCWEAKHPFLDFQVKPDNSLSLPNPRDPPDDFITPPNQDFIREQIRTAQQNNALPNGLGGGTGSV